MADAMRRTLVLAALALLPLAPLADAGPLDGFLCPDFTPESPVRYCVTLEPRTCATLAVSARQLDGVPSARETICLP